MMKLGIILPFPLIYELLFMRFHTSSFEMNRSPNSYAPHAISEMSLSTYSSSIKTSFHLDTHTHLLRDWERDMKMLWWWQTRGKCKILNVMFALNIFSQTGSSFQVLLCRSLCRMRLFYCSFYVSGITRELSSISNSASYHLSSPTSFISLKARNWNWKIWKNKMNGFGKLKSLNFTFSASIHQMTTFPNE